MNLKIKYSILSLFMLSILACSNEKINFLTFKKIDAHLHIRHSTTALLDQAVSDNFKVIAIIHDRYDIGWQIAFIEKQKAIHPDHINFLTTFTMKGWDEPGWQEKTIDHLNRAFNNGAIGVKVWKNIGIEFRDENGDFIMIDHPRFDPVLDFIESQDKTLTGHIVEPVDCWLPLEEMKSSSNREYYTKNPQYYMYIHPEYPSHDELVQSYERMLEKHPRIRYVGCHLAGFEHSLNELAKRLDIFPNMAVDLAARIDDIQLLNRDEIQSFFIKYQDRILYGTDLSINEIHDPQQYAVYAHQIWKTDWTYFATDYTLITPGSNKPAHGLNLPKSVLKKIYWENAKKWYPGL